MLTSKSNILYPMRSVKVRPSDSLSDHELYGPSFRRGNRPLTGSNGQDSVTITEFGTNLTVGNKWSCAKVSKRAMDTLIVTLCFAGLLLYLTLTSIEYFKYTTISRTLIVAPKLIHVPSLSLCFNYPNLINREGLLRNTSSYANLSIDEETKRALEKNPKWELEYLQRHLTARNIFDLTPNHDQIMVSARVRIANSSVIMTLTGAHIKEHFRRRRYLRMGFVCYHFQVTKLGARDSERRSEKLRNSSPEPRMSTSDIKNSFLSPGMIYEVTLNKSYFEDAHYFTAEVFHGDEFPKELSIAVHGSRSLGSGVILENIFYLSYYMKTSRYLEYPYQGACVNYNQLAIEFLPSPRVSSYAGSSKYFYPESQDSCFDHCYIDAIEKELRVLPYEAIIARKLDRTFFTFEGINERNDTLIKKIDVFMDLERACERKCAKNDCSETMYVTNILTSQYFPNLVFRVYIPNAHSIIAEAKEETSITEYLNYLFSYFSIFFGFSVLGFGTKITNVFVQNLKK